VATITIIRSQGETCCAAGGCMLGRLPFTHATRSHGCHAI
jgi:hypothetical protein